MSRVTAIISALVICIIVCLSWAVNHYRDNAITYKAQRDKKMPENWSWRTRQLPDMQMRQRDVAALDAKYTKELADAKAENDALRVMMLPLVVVGCTSKKVCQSVREAKLPPPAWIMQPPPTGRHRRTGLFHPQRGWSLCKNNWKEPRSILMSSADRAAHIDGQLMQLLWEHTIR